jgi:hypothetical protein
MRTQYHVYVGTWGGVRANENQERKTKNRGIFIFRFSLFVFPRGGGRLRENAKNATVGSRENARKGM